MACFASFLKVHFHDHSHAPFIIVVIYLIIIIINIPATAAPSTYAVHPLYVAPSLSNASLAILPVAVQRTLAALEEELAGGYLTQKVRHMHIP